MMGRKLHKRADGWKVTREGSKAHYFTAWVDELDKSLCQMAYDWEQLEPITHDDLRPGDYCKFCSRKRPVYLAQHYALPDLERLIAAAEKVTERRETVVLRQAHDFGAWEH